MNRFGIPYFDQQVREAEAAGETRFISEEDTWKMAQDLVEGNWGRLAGDQALTGEWIIFAKYYGQNYYLCLGFHEQDQNQLRRQIDEVCCREFPFLTELLLEANRDA